MKSFILGGLVVLVISGCAPPFIEDLNRAAGLTGRMTMVGTVGSVSFGNDTNVRFYPTKPTASSIDGVDVESGFIVSTYTTSGVPNDNLRFAYNTSGGQASTSNSTSFPTTSADPNYPFYEYDVAVTTSTANLVVLNVASNTYWYYAVSLPNGSLPSPSTGSLSSVFTGSPSVYGAQMTPAPGAPDTFNFLLWISPSTVQNGSVTESGGAFTFMSQSNISTSSVLSRRLYGVNLQGVGYTSYISAGNWLCDRMSGGVTQTLSGVSNRIDAVLTSGDLLSTQGGTLRLYDANGSQLFSKPLNGLQYCYEAYVGSTPYVFFTLPMSLQNNQWVFNVYAIATSSMGDLGK
jgi:hypothetical protein